MVNRLKVEQICKTVECPHCKNEVPIIYGITDVISPEPSKDFLQSLKRKKTEQK